VECNSNHTGANSPLAIVEAACLGKGTCAVPFGGGGHSPLGDPCPDVVKSLAARIQCTGAPAHPNPPTSQQVASSKITEVGTAVWDGAKLVGTPTGILSAKDTPGGVAFEVVGSAAFAFSATAA
jgi:hypothetical protein